MEFAGMLVQSVYCRVYVFGGRRMYENGRKDLCKKYINYSLKDEDEEKWYEKEVEQEPNAIRVTVGFRTQKIINFLAFIVL